MRGGNGKWSSDQCFKDHVNIDTTTSINLVSTSAYVSLLLSYGVKMDTPFLKNIETESGYILRSC